MARAGARATLKPKLLLVHRGGETFAAGDEGLLSDAYEVERHDGLSVADLARGALAAWRADAVLCWFVSIHAVVPLLVARLRRKPVVLIPGSYEVVWLPEIGYGWQGSRWRRAIVARLLRAATAVVAVSPTMVDKIRAASGVAAVLVPNTVEPAEAVLDRDRSWDVATAAVSIDPDARRRKGVDLYYDVAARCPELSFVLVGPDPGLEPPPNLRVTGLVEPHKAAALIGAARVYVQPTRGYEAFGVAVLEAMVRGATPVVTDVGSLAWVVGDTGVVVPADDTGALARAVAGALASPSGQAARQRALEVFSPTARKEGLLHVLRSP